MTMKNEKKDELPQTVERFLTNYAEALSKVPEDKRDRISPALETFKEFLKVKNVSCPKCGNNKLQWSCGHDF